MKINPRIKSNSHDELLTRIYKLLEIQRFREYSRGWFKGYIIVSDGTMYGKRLKRVNPRIKFREYDLVSKYPKLLYADTDGVIIQK